MAATQSNRQRGQETRSQIAEMVANGSSVTACAEVLGISQEAIWKHWRTIKRELGWQAS